MKEHYEQLGEPARITDEAKLLSIDITFDDAPVNYKHQLGVPNNYYGNSNLNQSKTHLGL